MVVGKSGDTSHTKTADTSANACCYFANFTKRKNYNDGNIKYMQKQLMEIIFHIKNKMLMVLLQPQKQLLILL